MSPDAELSQVLGGGVQTDVLRVPVPYGLLKTLAAGDAGRADRALRIAERRLSASGIPPKMRRVSAKAVNPRLLLAACLWPLHRADLARLVKLVVEDPNEDKQQQLRTTVQP